MSERYYRVGSFESKIKQILADLGILFSLIITIFLFYVFRYDAGSDGDFFSFFLREHSTEFVGAAVTTAIVFFIYNRLSSKITNTLTGTNPLEPSSKYDDLDGVFDHHSRSEDLVFSYIACCVSGERVPISSNFTLIGRKRESDDRMRKGENAAMATGAIVQESRSYYQNAAMGFSELFDQLGDTYTKLQQGEVDKVIVDVTEGGFIAIKFPQAAVSRFFGIKDPHEVGGQRPKTHVYVFGVTKDQAAINSGAAVQQLDQIYREISSENRIGISLKVIRDKRAAKK